MENFALATQQAATSAVTKAAADAADLAAKQAAIAAVVASASPLSEKVVAEMKKHKGALQQSNINLKQQLMERSQAEAAARARADAAIARADEANKKADGLNQDLTSTIEARAGAEERAREQRDARQQAEQRATALADQLAKAEVRTKAQFDQESLPFLEMLSSYNTCPSQASLKALEKTDIERIKIVQREANMAAKEHSFGEIAAEKSRSLAAISKIETQSLRQIEQNVREQGDALKETRRQAEAVAAAAADTAALVTAGAQKQAVELENTLKLQAAEAFARATGDAAASAVSAAAKAAADAAEFSIQVKTPPLPRVSTVLVAKTPPLPRLSTAFVAKTPPLPRVSPQSQQALARATQDAATEAVGKAAADAANIAARQVATEVAAEIAAQHKAAFPPPPPPPPPLPPPVAEEEDGGGPAGPEGPGESTFDMMAAELMADESEVISASCWRAAHICRVDSEALTAPSTAHSPAGIDARRDASACRRARSLRGRWRRRRAELADGGAGGEDQGGALRAGPELLSQPAVDRGQPVVRPAGRGVDGCRSGERLVVHAANMDYATT